MNRFFSVTYSLITRLAAIILVPAVVFKGFFRNRTFLEHIGIYSKGVARPGEKSIWIHCSSVGEVKIAVAVIEELRKAIPSKRIVLTVVTQTGKKIAHDLLADDVEIYFFPLDLGFCLKKAFHQINPERIILTETELYPNFITYAIAADIRLYIINGRISDKSYQKYLAIRDWLGPMLRKFTLIMMQSENDLQRIISLGADPGRCEPVENIKYDLMRKQLDAIDPDQVRKKLRLSSEAEVIVAGSTRGGEERIIARVFSELKKRYPQLLLVIAPRHLERLNEVQAYIREANLNYVLRSAITESTQADNYDVILLDTMGELTSVYSIANAAFVGGSLVPKGGQNPLEPIGQGVPTCFGPHMENFSEIARTALDLKLAVVVKDQSELQEFFESVLMGGTKAFDPRILFDKVGGSAGYSAMKILES
jgi:3-deoxy-D-manno-octulosonic-acid transferase